MLEAALYFLPPRFWSSYPRNLIPNESSVEIVVWTPSGSGFFSINFAWECWRFKQVSVAWCNLIWCSGHIPRFSVIAWLAIRERFNNRDRLTKAGLCNDPRCVLCGSESLCYLLYAKGMSLYVIFYMQREIHFFLNC